MRDGRPDRPDRRAIFYMDSLSSLAGRNAIFLPAAIWMDSPVAGFRPIRASRDCTCRMPRPLRRILSPFVRCRVVSATKSPSMPSATFFGRSWPSANWAAICLSVTVTCGAAFAATAFLTGAAAAFLAAGAAFFAAGTALTGAAALLATATGFNGTAAFLATAGFLAGGISNSFGMSGAATCSLTTIRTTRPIRHFSRFGGTFSALSKTPAVDHEPITVAKVSTKVCEARHERDRQGPCGSVKEPPFNGDALVDYDIISLTTQIVSAHVANNETSPDQLPTLIRDVHQALATVGQASAEPIKAEPAVDVKKSVFSDHIVCLECGVSMKMLKRHLATDHGMTPDEYRAKWGLPHTYPMVAPEYAAKRSQLAKDAGLGRKVEAPPPPKKAGRSKRG